MVYIYFAAKNIMLNSTNKYKQVYERCLSPAPEIYLGARRVASIFGDAALLATRSLFGGSFARRSGSIYPSFKLIIILVMTQPNRSIFKLSLFVDTTLIYSWYATGYHAWNFIGNRLQFCCDFVDFNHFISLFTN